MCHENSLKHALDRLGATGLDQHYPLDTCGVSQDVGDLHGRSSCKIPWQNPNVWTCSETCSILASPFHGKPYMDVQWYLLPIWCLYAAYYLLSWPGNSISLSTLKTTCPNTYACFYLKSTYLKICLEYSVYIFVFLICMRVLCKPSALGCLPKNT